MTLQKGRTRGRPRAFHDKSASMVVHSLDRAMRILKTVGDGPGQSLTEIAEASGVPASSAYRILITLEMHGMVQFDETRQLWHVGLEAFRIGSKFLVRTRLVEQSRPVLERLVANTGETANLAIADKGEVIFLNQAETHKAIRAFFRPGTRGPIHASGAGKALLAFMPPANVEAVLASARFDTFTENTIATRDALDRELELIRGRGWSVDNEEHTVGMRCIAAPIFNLHGEAIATISLSGPSIRVTPEHDEEYGELVKSAAGEVTHSIGGQEPAAT